MKEIILASTSKYRKDLLERLAIKFSCIAPGVNEDIYKNQIKDPLKLAEKLGLEKAKAVSLEHPKCLIIGSDQVAEIEGEILGKPKTMENAFKQIKLLQGKEHRLITSFSVFNEGKFHTETNITILKMRALSDSQVKNYLRMDIPFDCAGSYKLELHGISLFEQIQTEDHTAIIGLPLIQLANLMNKIGFCIPPLVDVRKN